MSTCREGVHKMKAPHEVDPKLHDQVQLLYRKSKLVSTLTPESSTSFTAFMAESLSKVFHNPSQAINKNLQK